MGHPLHQITAFPEECIIKVKKLNITTAEEFVAITNTEDKREKMAKVLEVTPARLTNLIKLAKEALPAEIAKKMETPVDTSQYGLGALEPKKENS